MRAIADGDNSFFLHLGDLHYQDIKSNDTRLFLSGALLPQTLHTVFSHSPCSVRHDSDYATRPQHVAGNGGGLRVGRPRLRAERLRRQ